MQYDGTGAPTPGFYIEKDSSLAGVTVCVYCVGTPHTQRMGMMYQVDYNYMVCRHIDNYNKCVKIPNCAGNYAVVVDMTAAT